MIIQWVKRLTDRLLDQQPRLRLVPLHYLLICSGRSGTIGHADARVTIFESTLLTTRITAWAC